MDNPYLDDFEQLQEQSTFRGQTWFGQRKELVEQYAWAVPNEDVIRYIAGFDDIIYEFGAGSGYWANLVQAAGGNIEPIDNDPPAETWTDIVETDARHYFDQFEDSVVLMVWPPYDESMSARIAQQGPAHILYVGETRGGCTADDSFFDIVESQYGFVGKVEIPSYVGIHDDFYHYVRKT